LLLVLRSKQQCKTPPPHLHPPKRRRFLRFKQLKEMGIVGDYQTLEDLVEKHGMPRGFKLSHKVLLFDEDEVLAWLETKRRSAA
jgi:predicted DNA-binding transcriptional regulator AlpA